MTSVLSKQKEIGRTIWAFDVNTRVWGIGGLIASEDGYVFYLEIVIGPMNIAFGILPK